MQGAVSLTNIKYNKLWYHCRHCTQKVCTFFLYKFKLAVASARILLDTGIVIPVVARKFLMRKPKVKRQDLVVKCKHSIHNTLNQGLG